MQVYVVHDAQGAGRVVGVFTDLMKAQAVVRVHPPYYQMVTCETDAVSEIALQWLPTDAQRDELRALCR